jgi:hypothetical protein
VSEPDSPKSHATYLPRRARDEFDLCQLQRQPCERSLVRTRTLTVPNLWSVADAFEPERFRSNRGAATSEWGDLARLIRKDQPPKPQEIIAGCSQGDAFLRELTPSERGLTVAQ